MARHFTIEDETDDRQQLGHGHFRPSNGPAIHFNHPPAPHFITWKGLVYTSKQLAEVQDEIAFVKNEIAIVKSKLNQLFEMMERIERMFGNSINTSMTSK